MCYSLSPDFSARTTTWRRTWLPPSPRTCHSLLSSAPTGIALHRAPKRVNRFHWAPPPSPCPPAPSPAPPPTTGPSLGPCVVDTYRLQSECPAFCPYFCVCVSGMHFSMLPWPSLPAPASFSLTGPLGVSRTQELFSFAVVRSSGGVASLPGRITDRYSGGFQRPCLLAPPPSPLLHCARHLLPCLAGGG